VRVAHRETGLPDADALLDEMPGPVVRLIAYEQRRIPVNSAILH
jgi:hypothetical protein